MKTNVGGIDKFRDGRILAYLAVMGGDGIEHQGRFVELLQELHAGKGVGLIAFGQHKADVMQKACALRLSGVELQFRSHQAGEHGYLPAVQQQVLPIDGMELHLADEVDHLGRHVRNLEG